jgi:hypothetical protein
MKMNTLYALLLVAEKSQDGGAKETQEHTEFFSFTLEGRFINYIYNNYRKNERCYNLWLHTLD